MTNIRQPSFDFDTPPEEAVSNADQQTQMIRILFSIEYEYIIKIYKQ